MLTKSDRVILTRLFDELDRLFDGYSSVGDVAAMIESSLKSLQAQHLIDVVRKARDRLRPIVDTVENPSDKHDRRVEGLIATEELRGDLSEALHTDRVENPRRRHRLSEGESER